MNPLRGCATIDAAATFGRFQEVGPPLHHSASVAKVTCRIIGSTNALRGMGELMLYPVWLKEPTLIENGAGEAPESTHGSLAERDL